MTGMHIFWRSACAGLALLVVPATAAGQAVVMKKKFIEKYKDRVSIEAKFLVDDYSSVHSISADGKDGDIHVGGRSRQVGLPLVAEIMNARRSSQTPAVQLVRSRKGDKVGMVGVWRLWFEHPPEKGTKQIQKYTLPPPGNSNPPHIYEIHPVTKVDDKAVPQSFVPIPGFRAYEADVAFGRYEKLKLRVKANQTTVVMDSTKVGYNYVDFTIKLRQKPWTVPGGLMVLADIQDGEGNPIETREPIRIVFVDGTAPADAARNKGKGARLRLLGLPRINLDEVWAVLPHAQQPQEIRLPYEIIAAAVLED